jgi:hypothetical protein
MKFKLFIAAGAFALAFLSSGCYTEFATHEPSGSGYSEDDQGYVTSSSDSTDTSAVDNQYFGDDSYRHSRYQLSFGYYYPWGYDVPIYNPWYDDPWYWPDMWRPYVLWPYPTWYPYGGYYGHHHYWGYYNDPWYNGGGGYYGNGGSGAPHRTRLMGPTREASGAGIRQRTPIASPTLGTTGGSGTTQPTVRARGGDTPWWERKNQDERRTQQTRPTSAQAQTERRQRQVGQAPGASTQRQGTATVRPRQERRERQQSAGQSSGRQSQPRYAPPANNGGGGRERSSGGSAPSGRTSSGGSSSNGGSRTRSGR